jgi:addiction module HigA family antidote
MVSLAGKQATGAVMLRTRLHPGRILREEYMDPLRLDAASLARALGVPEAGITRLVRGQDPVGSDIALRLARCFRTSPQFWLALQNAYDLSLAQAEHGADIEASVQPLAA